MSWMGLVVLLLVLGLARGDDHCLGSFSPGKENFVLDTNGSVTDGAAFLSSLQVERAEECVRTCCSDPSCNLALVETRGEEEHLSCFTFNCLYKQKRVCHFLRKDGFKNFLSNTVFQDYLQQSLSGVEDKPPVASAGQDRVVQPHEDVTLNGIESKDDREIVKYEWTQVSGASSGVVMSESVFKDGVVVSNLTAGLYRFRLTVTDDSGQSSSSEVSVLVLTPEQSLHHCLVPKKEGPCRGHYPRWHYNAASEKCEEFKFGGCKPNLNNYLSLNECQNACDKVSVSTPTHSGRHGHIQSEQCDAPCGPEQFTCSNNCCIDKELECDQESQCSDGSDEEKCTDLNRKFTRLLQIPLDNSKSHCVDPPVTGPCRASLTHWYYNPYERRCVRFNYGGCTGNNNRFELEEKCLQSCQSVTESDVFARRGQFEKQEAGGNTAAVAVAVVLAVAIAVLLVVILCCVLKDRRSKHQPVPVLHASGYPDSDKLVYNSTTKPI